MNIALFGGTFDPIHTGHLRAARSAARRFGLQRVLFVPCGVPPHKPGAPLTPYPHRFAMVALAAQGEPAFLPSTLEAPKLPGRPNYSVETAQAARRMLGVRDRLYFILGMDSFLDLPNWKDYRRLFELVDFIVAARPGFGGPHALRALTAGLGNGLGARTALEGTSLLLSGEREVKILTGLRAPMASRDIRRAASAGRPLTGLVPRLVEEYIVKEGLYRSGPGRGGK